MYFTEHELRILPGVKLERERFVNHFIQQKIKVNSIITLQNV